MQFNGLKSLSRARSRVLLTLIIGFVPATAVAQVCEEQKLRPSEDANPTASLFGEAVDIDGDFAVVGGSQLNGPAGVLLNVGGVYFYARDGSQDLGERWEIEDTQRGSAGGDMFGQAVAISGDTVIAGAPGDEPMGFVLTGRAHVYVRSGSSWSLEATLAPTNDVNGAFFGISVAIDGDLAVVGAIQDDDDSSTPTVAQTGAAYVYERSGTTWNLQAKLLATFGASNDNFGSAVAVDEASRTVVVGAKLDDLPSLSNAGSAFVFSDPSGVGTAWAQRATLDAGLSNIEEDAQFGCSVAFDGTTIVVGACLEDDAGPDSDRGAVYVFSNNGSSWNLDARLVDSFGDNGNGGDDDDRFGRSVDVDGTTIVVGSLLAEQAFVFENSGTVWSGVVPALYTDNAVSNARFGLAVACSTGRVLAGAPLDDTSQGSNAGAAYVFAPFYPEAHEFYGTPEATGQDCTGPGTGSYLTITGIPSVSDADPFLIEANDVTFKSVLGGGCSSTGALIWGVSGRSSLSFGNGGTILVKSYFRARPELFEVFGGSCPPVSPCGYTLNLDFNEVIQSGDYPELEAGVRVNAQWILDNQFEPTGMPPADNKESTDAVEFRICP